MHKLVSPSTFNSTNTCVFSTEQFKLQQKFIAVHSILTLHNHKNFNQQFPPPQIVHIAKIWVFITFESPLSLKTCIYALAHWSWVKSHWKHFKIHNLNFKPVADNRTRTIDEIDNRWQSITIDNRWTIDPKNFCGYWNWSIVIDSQYYSTIDGK